MKAKSILKKLDYLPRWAWYLIFFCAAGPFGLLGVYLVFHVLKKAAKDQAEEEYAAARTQYHSRAAGRSAMNDDEVERRWQKVEASAARTASQRSADAFAGMQDMPIAENAELDEVILAGRDAMKKIRRANDIIADEALSAQIDSIENSCAQILSILEQRPQLLSQLRTFLRYYLPTTLRLLDARAKLENNANTHKAREVRARISEAVGAIDKAFLKQAEALDAYRFIDLESEMDVLRDMLKADGLIDEDETQNDPFASVIGGR